MKFYVYAAPRVGWVLREDGTTAAMTSEQVDWWLYATREWTPERHDIEARLFDIKITL